MSHMRNKRLLAAYTNAVNRARLRAGKRYYYGGGQPQHRQGHSPPPPPPPGYPQYQQQYPQYQQQQYTQQYHQQYQQQYQQQQQQYQQQQQAQYAAQPKGAETNEKGSWPNPVVMQVTRSEWQILGDLVKGLVLAYILSQVISVEFVTSSPLKKEQQAAGKQKEVETEEHTKDKDTDKDKDKDKSKASEKDQKSDGIVSSLFSSKPNKDEVVPVDLNSVNHNVRWEDILGCDEAKAELVEVTEFLKNPDKFTRLGGKLPKGYLLVGPPGTGKTMLAKAIAKEANVPFFYASGAQFEEVFVGVGSKRVRELFAAARKQGKPCLVFIDEIDAVGGKRSRLDASHDRATINQLLAEMDGFKSSDSIIVIAATNSPKTLDKALTRPGRLDRMVSVDPPDLKGRRQILEHYLKKVTAGDIDVKQIAQGTSGMTGADLSNVVNLATITAAKRNYEAVTTECMEEAKDRVSMGIEHRSRKIPEYERRNTAYHEAGHALVAMFTDRAAPLHKATIIPRGQALGLTVQLPADDQYSTSLSEMNARLRVLMGGRIAEQIVFGESEVTTGASNDLEQATKLARAMVRKYGLSSSLGLMDYSFADDPNGVFLSDSTKNKIEVEVKTLVDSAHHDALVTITKHREVLNKIAEGLLDNDTLSGVEMRKMANIPEPKEETSK